MQRRFRQVDVFSTVPYRGNPVAVVLDGEGLSAEVMQQFARWMNLSETTFVLPPGRSGADYKVRIFTPESELPFAGHPTLGTCHAWLEAGPAGPGADSTTVVQDCPAGLIELRRTDAGLAFSAPPLVRFEPAEESLVEHLASVLGIARTDIVDAHWVDNGPGWVAVLLSDADAVRAVRPAPDDLCIGVVGPYPAGSDQAFEVRAFFSGNGMTFEDPVTGSLNASLAQWLLGSGRLTAPYVARQGTVLGRTGRVHISEGDGEIWVAGATRTVVSGEVDPDA